MKIQIWNTIQKSNSCLFFDATGSIVRKINTIEPLLYSIVAHDAKNKQVISLADFITTCNTSETISKYLFSIFNILEKPNLIVTDLSWALINSVLLILNKCKLINIYQKE